MKGHGEKRRGRCWIVTMAQRAEFAAFLRTKREQAAPAGGRLRGLGRRRAPGLRREEIARLVGVSVTWYSWLEEGLGVTPNQQVLDALARALHLTTQERAHFFALAEVPADPTADAGEVPETVRELVTALEPNPAYLLNRYWDVVAHNRSAAQLTVDFAALEPADRNLVWLTFTDPRFRRTIVDWSREAQSLLVKLRFMVRKHPNDERFGALADRVRQASREFRDWWPRQDLDPAAGNRQQFHLADYGLLTLNRVLLRPIGLADAEFVVHLPADPGTADAVSRLAVSAAN